MLDFNEMKNLLCLMLQLFVISMTAVATIASVTLFICWLFSVDFEKTDRELKECFIQSPRTEECEYKLWKYTAMQNKTSTTVVPMPVIVGR